jgi:SAM-dependent methyltransferase
MPAEPVHAETADSGAGDGAPAFRTDLYRGTAAYYDRYRPPYPPELLADLLERAGVSGRGRLLDLACGTGHLAFPLRHRFTEVWAVDQEPDMVEQVRVKAAAEHAAEIRPIRSSAQSLSAEPGGFELVTVGNAFHGLERDLVARRILDWLVPGGGLALCWSSSPWAGERDRQRALAALPGDWRTRLGGEDRVPAGWEAQRRRRPGPPSRRTPRRTAATSRRTCAASSSPASREAAARPRARPAGQREPVRAPS